MISVFLWPIMAHSSSFNLFLNYIGFSQMKPNDLVHSMFYCYESIERSYDIDRKFRHVLLFYLLGAFNEHHYRYYIAQNCWNRYLGETFTLFATDKRRASECKLIRKIDRYCYFGTASCWPNSDKSPETRTKGNGSVSTDACGTWITHAINRTNSDCRFRTTLLMLKMSFR